MAEPIMARRRVVPDASRQPITTGPVRDSWAEALDEIHRVDVAAEYRALTQELELGVKADSYTDVLYAADAASKRLHRASVVHQRVRIDVEAAVDEINQKLQELIEFGRSEYSERLAKNASTERVLELVKLTRANEVDKLVRRKREAEASLRVFEKLEEAWKQRCKNLDTMLGRVAR